MRDLLKVCVLSLVATIAFGLIAGPASAQARDPFEPLVSESSEVATVEDAATTTTSNEGPADTTPAVGGLAMTGTDPTGWLFVAYVLIALGAAAIFTVQVQAPGRLAIKRTLH